MKAIVALFVYREIGEKIMQHDSGKNRSASPFGAGSLTRLWRAFVAVLATCAMMLVAVPAASANQGDDSADTAKPISTGQTVSGKILYGKDAGSDGDFDWYKFSVPSAGTISLTFSNQQGSSQKWEATLYDSNLKAFTSYTFGANAINHPDTAKIGVPAGTYWVSIDSSHWDFDSSYAGGLEYHFRVNYTKTSNWETEWNNEAEHADPISTGQTVSGTILYSRDIGGDGDFDWYKFSVPSAGAINLTFSNQQASHGQWTATLYDPNLQEFASYTFGANAVNHPDTAKIGVSAGTYWVRVDSNSYDWYDSYAGGLEYHFRVNYTKTSDWETEWNNDFDTADPISVNKPINGVLMNGDDVDWYKFSTSSADTFRIQFANQQKAEGEWYVSVKDKDLNEVYGEKFSAAGTSHSGKTVTLPRGVHYVTVDGKDDVTGLRYTLTANWGKPRFTVRFDSNGGSGVASQTVVQGAKAKRPANPTHSGKVFAGWYTAKSGGAKVDFNRAVNGNVTYYAHWNDPPFSRFWDVTRDTPHGEDINWLVGQKITTGYKDGSFRGGRSVVRQDMAAFLYRLAGSPSFNENKARNPFVDVNRNTPHYKEILWLASTGISTGWNTPHGKEFRGMRPVVRQDMAAFLKRFADYRKAKPKLGNAVNFRDVNGSTPHAADIAWLARTGVTTGWKDGTFRGMNAVVRQDMAAFLHRMKANVVK
ncbi:InlB B-repeat-containing protein [Bifidobacterium ramosum]|uniref:InlB B-repeat-containing protein n=1 Tax=Bifidobacterium ramosum TaxID=1798158 RepID=UPI0013D81B59|nr:InlB B-repeat-containing protein [Bifidobacterium ramosum]